MQWLQFFCTHALLSCIVKFCCQVHPLAPPTGISFCLFYPPLSKLRQQYQLEFGRKTNFIPDSLRQSFPVEKAMLGVWSGLRKQMAREVPGEQECWMPLPLLAQGGPAGPVSPKPSESPRGNCCGWKGGSGRSCGSAASMGRVVPSLLPFSHIPLAPPCWPSNQRVEGPQDTNLMVSLEHKAGQGANLEKPGNGE